jgi:hypothetical protein
MPSPTYAQIASSYSLWGEYVDPDATTSEKEFDAMSHADRVALMVEAFGPDRNSVPTVEQELDDSAIGGGFHRWAVIGGSITITTDQLRPLLEEAYDPNMPDWVALVDAEA